MGAQLGEVHLHACLYLVICQFFKKMPTCLPMIRKKNLMFIIANLESIDFSK